VAGSPRSACPEPCVLARACLCTDGPHAVARDGISQCRRIERETSKISEGSAKYCPARGFAPGITTFRLELRVPPYEGITMPGADSFPSMIDTVLRLPLLDTAQLRY